MQTQKEFCSSYINVPHGMLCLFMGKLEKCKLIWESGTEIANTHSRQILLDKIKSDLKLGCFSPANGATVAIETRPLMEIEVSASIIEETLRKSLHNIASDEGEIKIKQHVFHGILDCKRVSEPQIIDWDRRFLDATRSSASVKIKLKL